MISTMSKGFKNSSKFVADKTGYLFWSSFSIWKYQLGSPLQMWQKYSMQNRMVDLRR